MSQFYQVDSRKISLKEYWWWSSSPLVLIPLVTKCLRLQLPVSSEDPNTESTLPFLYSGLPSELEERFAPLTQELAQLGFFDPVYHIIYDPGSLTTWYWATFRHSSGQHFARIHHRVWARSTKPKPILFAMFMTRFADGTFLVSSAGRPDMAAPDKIQMIRKKGAKTGVLWQLHEQKAQELGGQRMIAPINSHDELVYACEALHVLQRDFHLARGAFRPRTEKESQNAQAVVAKLEETRPYGCENPEVLVELDKLQTKKTSRQMMLGIFVASLAAFVILGRQYWTWEVTLALVAVLLFHEAGHWLMMRIFKYRNVQMLFIPMFGAAVIGRHWNVAGWKKALVSLAGPIPGIFVGLGLGIASIVYHNQWMNKAALLLLLLNGANLLPILPLDGGHVLQHTIFCRNRWLEAVFRILAIGGLFLLAIGSRVFIGLASALLVAVPIMFKLARVKEDLAKLDLPQPGPNEDRIPTPTAVTIVRAVKEALGSKMTVSNKVLAQHSLGVFESLNAKPPGVLATLGLLSIQGAGLFLALVMGLVLTFTGMVGVKDFARMAARQPRHSLACGTLQRSGADAMRPGHTIVTTFKKEDKAAAAFRDLAKQLPANSGVTLYGESVLLTIPAGDEALRDKWFDLMQQRSTNVFVRVSNAPVAVSMQFIAPHKAAASNIVEELGAYFHSAVNMRLIAPWSPQARDSKYAEFRKARATWQKMGGDLGSIYTNKTYTAYNLKIRAATKRGALAEAKKLTEEQQQKAKELRAQARQAFNSRSGSLEAELAKLQSTLEDLSYTNRVERQKVLREVAARLGEIPYDHDKPDQRAAAYLASSGSISMEGLLCELRWAGFADPQGLVSMTEWLCNKGCLQFKYNLEAGWLNFDEDEADNDMP